MPSDVQKLGSESLSTFTTHSRQSNSNYKGTEYVRYVFVTLTYKRDASETFYWKRVSSDWNRYIQRVRRLHCNKCGYLRTIEAHEDLYPHLHAVLDFGDATIRVENTKFFDQNLYTKWKTLWIHGLSDYQRPYRGPHGVIPYIIKYITKSSTSKTVWRKYYGPPEHISVKSADQNTIPPKKPTPATTNILLDPSSFFCKQFNIKQCTWSRNFKFPQRAGALSN